MLRSLSDYRLIASFLRSHDFTNITGRIIPTEDVGLMPCALRYEDFAFLSEGISERLGTAVTHVSKYISLANLANLCASVRGFYTDNHIWANPALDGYDSGFREYDTYVEADRAYADKLYRENDSNVIVPTGSHVTLDADILRRCFFDLENIRRKIGPWGASVNPYCIATNRGSLELSTMEVYTPEGGGEDRRDSYLYTIEQYDGKSYSLPSLYYYKNLNHFTFALTGQCFIYANGWKAWYEHFGEHQTTYEGFYNGEVSVVSTDTDSRPTPKKLLVCFQVRQIYSPTATGSSTVTNRYVWRAFDLTKKSAAYVDGVYYPRVFSTTLINTRRNWEALVQRAFPSASFPVLSVDTYYEYQVRAWGYAVVTDWAWRSEIASTGWSWHP